MAQSPIISGTLTPQQMVDLANSSAMYHGMDSNGNEIYQPQIPGQPLPYSLNDISELVQGGYGGLLNSGQAPGSADSASLGPLTPDGNGNYTYSYMGSPSGQGFWDNMSGAISVLAAPFAMAAGMGALGAGAADASGGLAAGDIGTEAAGLTTANTLGMPAGLDAMGGASVAAADASGGSGLLGGAGGAMDMTGSAAIPGAAGTEGGIGAGSIFTGASNSSTGLLGWLANNTNPVSLGMGVAQTLLGQSNASAMQNLLSQAQGYGATGVDPATRLPAQNAANGIIANQGNNAFTQNYLTQAQNLINANVAKSGNASNVFATAIPQIMTSMDSNQTNYLNALSGIGGFNQSQAPASAATTNMALPTIAANTAQYQGLATALGGLSKSAPSFGQIFS